MTKNGKKIGRPKKTEEQKALDREAKLSAVSASGPIKPVKAPKQKKSEKLAASAWQTTFDKIEVLAHMGAVHIKVDNVEVAFPPDSFAHVSTRNSDSPTWNAESREWAVREPQESQEDNVRQMAKVAEQDNPDQYAEQQDRWANHEPMPRI